MKRFILVMCLIVGAMSASAASTPTLYFTDLQSGPVGSIVTVYGANLQGPVTLNGVGATVVAASSSKVSFAVPNTSSGSIAMGGSNALPFTVRGGNIYYVATTGSDSNSGAQGSPWATIPHAFNTAACGDVIYAMNGVSQTGLDNYGASLSVQRKCSQATPLALIGYPGATVTVGSASGSEYGIRNPDINGDGFNGIVLANLVIRGNNTAIKDVNNSYWRIVGNDFSCPNGGGEAACVFLDAASYVQILGNSIHDTGAGGTKYYHSLYGTTNTLHVEVGWNSIYNNKSCRGIQFYSTGGSPEYDLIVHDNVVTGQLCDGINFSTVDATKGPVEAYNNLVYHVGLGPAGALGTPNMACIASLGYGSPGGTAYIYGNTLSDCGSGGGSTAGAITVLSGSPTVQMQSNLILQNPGEVIYSPNTTQSLVAAGNNVLLTTGTAGVVDSNYLPLAGSPAIGAGTALSGMMHDLAGKPRPQSGSEDAGAYLYSTSSGSTSGPTATLSVSTLSFGNQTVGTTSYAQSVTLSNSGGSALSISGIAVGGTNANQFSASNNCGSSLAAGSSCTLQAQFAPTTTGAMTATITVNSNASNPAQSITLTGTGTSASTPAVTLTPTSINFGSLAVNTTSSTQTVTVKNSGSATLNIAGVSLTGSNSAAFKVASGCGSTLASGASCAIQVQFAPTTTGTMTAAIAIADNASGSPQTVALSGTGIAQVSTAPAATLSKTSINFASQMTGTTSAPQTVTLTNSGTATLSISSIAVSGDFASTNTCGTSVAIGASCTISVTFTPATTGARTGALTVADNATGSPQTVTLSGTGTAISLTSSSSGLTLSSAGGSTSAGIQLASVGGFSGTVNLTCAIAYKGAGTPANPPACNLTPAQAQLASGTTSNSTLTVNSRVSGSTAQQASKWLHGGEGVMTALLLFGIVPRRKWRQLGLLIALGIVGVTATVGCGAITVRNPGAAASSSYDVTVTATSGTLTASVTIPLSVQ